MVTINQIREAYENATGKFACVDYEHTWIPFQKHEDFDPRDTFWLAHVDNICKHNELGEREECCGNNPHDCKVCAKSEHDAAQCEKFATWTMHAVDQGFRGLAAGYAEDLNAIADNYVGNPWGEFVKLVFMYAGIYQPLSHR